MKREKRKKNRQRKEPEHRKMERKGRKRKEVRGMDRRADKEPK